MSIPRFWQTPCDLLATPIAYVHGMQSISDRNGQANVNGGKALDHFKITFGIKPKTGGGIHLYVSKWEQIVKIHSLVGIKRIMEEVVPVCLQREWSKASMDSLVEIGTKERLPMSMDSLVEIGTKKRLPKIAVEMAQWWMMDVSSARPHTA